MPVADIGTPEVLKVLTPIWLRVPDMAGKVRGRIERVLSAAKVQKLRAGENPAAWKDQLEHLLPPRPKLPHGHRKAVPYPDAPAFMVRLRQPGVGGLVPGVHDPDRRAGERSPGRPEERGGP
jgi:hypothetical protein